MPSTKKPSLLFFAEDRATALKSRPAYQGQLPTFDMRPRGLDIGKSSATATVAQSLSGS